MTIRRISAAAKSTIDYSTQLPEGYAEQKRYDLNIDSAGNLYELVRAYRHAPNGGGSARENEPADNLIVSFKEDGTIKSITRLDAVPGEEFSAFHMAPFANGSFLVAGMSHKPGITYAEPSVLVFDGSGKRLVEVADYEERAASVSKDPGPAATGLAGQRAVVRHALRSVAGGNMVTAPDGNVYVLSGGDLSHLIAISPAGAVTQEIELKGFTPVKTEQVSEMGILGTGHFVLVLDSVPGRRSPNLTARAVLFDLSTGERIGQLDGSSALRAGMFAGCVASEDKWYFLDSSKNNKLALVTFTPQ